MAKTYSPGETPLEQPIQSTTDLDDGRITFKQETEATTITSSTAAPTASRNDTSVTKVNARYSPKGKHGQKYLAAGVRVSMRLWEEEPPARAKAQTQRQYETVGYVIKGRAELQLEGQILNLEPGDSWVVPKGAVHRYKILESFTAIEATCPPAEVHGRDQEP